MPLSARQQRFVDAYLVDPNATKAAIAAGYSAATAKQQGSRLLTNADIEQAVNSRREKASAKADLTLATHLARLAELAEDAAAANQYSAAVTAEVSRGKAVGLYVDKSEVKHSGKFEVRVRIEREGRRVTAS